MNLQQAFNNTELSNNAYQLHQWFEQKVINNSNEMFAQIDLLTKRYTNNHKWILVISDDANALMHKQQQSSPQANVLWVHSDKVSVNINNLKKTLAKGNCAAVALCNADLTLKQQEEIKSVAEQGNTHCVLLNNPSSLH